MAHPGFIAEFNNPVVYGHPLARLIERAGFEVVRISHKTTFVIRYQTATKLVELKSLLARTLKDRKGSVLLFSKKTAIARQLNKAGNMPNTWIQR
jgi:hypothetical protein